MKKQIGEMTDGEYKEFTASLWSLKHEPMPPTVLANGSRYEWDPSLNEVIEVCPDGSVFAVGEGLARSRQVKRGVETEHERAAAVAAGGTERLG